MATDNERTESPEPSTPSNGGGEPRPISSAIEINAQARERALESVNFREPRPLTSEIPSVALPLPTDNVNIPVAEGDDLAVQPVDPEDRETVPPEDRQMIAPEDRQVGAPEDRQMPAPEDGDGSLPVPAKEGEGSGAGQPSDLPSPPAQPARTMGSIPVLRSVEPQTETAALRLRLGRTEKVTFAFTFSIAMLTMLGPFSIDMIFPGYTQIRQEFMADSTAIHQVTSAYLLAFAAMSIFHGPLSDALGRKKVMATSLTIYILASLGAALSTSLGMVIAFRILQGLSAGGSTIISRVVIRDLYGGGRAQKLMSQVMMIFALAPAVAPIFGGWILLVGRWRWIFAAMMLYALITLVVMLVMIPETLPKDRRQPFSARGIFSSLGRVGRSGVLWRLSLALAATSQAHFVFIAAAPEIVPNLLHLSEQDYWILFVPIITGMIVGNYFVGRLADVVRRSRLITIAFCVSLAGSLLTLGLNLLAPELGNSFGLWHVLVLIGPLFVGMGSALMMAPVQLEILDMFPKERGAATSISTFMNLVNAAIISGVMVPLLGHSLAALAAGMLVLCATGAALWALHVVLARRGR